MQTITPVILSGGSGTRLWPMSTPQRPKQFLPLTDPHRSMFELTLARVQDRSSFGSPIIVANAMHRALIDEGLAAAGTEAGSVIFEPRAKNTAPAIALAALACSKPDALMLVMPSDHLIADVAAFHAACKAAAPAAENGSLITFGIHPTAPETGYGYIQMGEKLHQQLCKVESFVEKPPLEKAQAMLSEGGYAWNGGIFLFRADRYLEELEIHSPAILAACKDAMRAANRDAAAIFPDEAAFANCPSDSIDYAVMEKSDQVAVIPVDMGWSDVGSWDALAEVAPAAGESLSANSQNNFVMSDGVEVHLAGVQDMIVIASGNRVLITPRGQSQQVKTIAEALRERKA